MLQKIIRRMLKSINDEESYLEQFRNLLIFNNLCTKGMVVSEYELENAPFRARKDKTDKDGNDVEYNGEHNDKHNEENIEKDIRNGSLITPVSSYQNRTFRNLDEKVEITDAWKENIVKAPLKGCVEDRTNARKQMVLSVSCLYDDHETCEQAIQKWINLEERFVEN